MSPLERLAWAVILAALLTSAAFWLFGCAPARAPEPAGYGWGPTGHEPLLIAT